MRKVSSIKNQKLNMYLVTANILAFAFNSCNLFFSVLANIPFLAFSLFCFILVLEIFIYVGIDLYNMQNI